MIYLKLFLEFFRAGLFAVGGGLATIPFLTDISLRTGWFSQADLTNMIAVSESTPGPMGVNMASYVGYTVGGIPGGVVATLGLVTPSIIIILIVAAFLNRFRNNPTVEAIFYGLRPASTGLIAAAGWGVVCIALIAPQWSLSGRELHIQLDANWQCLLLALAVLVATRLPRLKNLHPIVWIALSAVAGIVLGL
jgi:chromate transporter